MKTKKQMIEYIESNFSSWDEIDTYEQHTGWYMYVNSTLVSNGIDCIHFNELNFTKPKTLSRAEMIEYIESNFSSWKDFTCERDVSSLSGWLLCLNPMGSYKLYNSKINYRNMYIHEADLNFKPETLSYASDYEFNVNASLVNRINFVEPFKKVGVTI